MAITETKWIWMNGSVVPWDDARIHILSHVVHYGSSIFEGIRCYTTPRGPAVFRLGDHVRRFFESCRIYRMELPYTRDEIEQAIRDVVNANELDGCYIRPVAYRGYREIGLDPTGCPVDIAIAAWPWGRYLGDDTANGVDIRVSSWRRMAPDTVPTMAKAGGNYLSSQLIKTEATRDGYAEAVALDVDGFVSEGSGENVFLVRQGKLITPSGDSSALLGITRDSVVTIAQSMGIPVVETRVVRELLYLADELFLTGTAAEVAAVRSVDRMPVGKTAPGPITAAISERLDEIVHGRADDRWGWLDLVKPRQPKTSKGRPALHEADAARGNTPPPKESQPASPARRRRQAATNATATATATATHEQTVAEGRLRDVPSEDRGVVTIDADHCKGCELCMTYCPKGALQRSDELNVQGYHPAYYVGQGCTGCAICYYVCPEPRAITVERRGGKS